MDGNDAKDEVAHQTCTIANLATSVSKNKISIIRRRRQTLESRQVSAADVQK